MSRKRRHEIRSDMRRILSNLDQRWQRAASGQLCQHLNHLLQQFEAGQIKRLLAWTAFFEGEVDLTSFMAGHIGSLEIYLPRSLPDRSMQFISIGQDWQAAVQSGEYGIPEPALESGKLYEFKDTDDSVVLVPGLAFDLQGNRLGRGKGYYDRFLGRSDMRQATVVGISWKLQLVESIPIESHDIPMDWICHEDGFLRTGLEYSEDF